MKKIFLLLLVLITQWTVYAQSEEEIDCSFLKNCKMKNFSTPDGGLVIFNDSIHMEYVQNKKYYVKSKLEWVSECEYNATILEYFWPDFIFPIGEVMNAKLVDIQNDTLFFNLKVRETEIKAKYKLIKE